MSAPAIRVTHCTLELDRWAMLALWFTLYTRRSKPGSFFAKALRQRLDGSRTVPWSPGGRDEEAST